MHKVGAFLFASALFQTVLGDGCSLISSEGNPATKATFQCTDNSLWLISVERRPEDCVYRRFVVDQSGVNTRDSRLTCDTAFRFIQDLVSNGNIPSTPDDLLPVVDFDNMRPFAY